MCCLPFAVSSAYLQEGSMHEAIEALIPTFDFVGEGECVTTNEASI